MGTAGSARLGSTSPAVYYTDPGYVIATLHAMVLVIALKPPNANMGLAMVNGAKRLVEKYGSAGVFVLIDREHDPPDEAARGAMLRAISSLPTGCVGLALNLEGEGFVAAAKRSVTTLAIMTARRPVPMKVFSSGTAAASWLLSHLGENAPRGLSPEALLRACQLLRDEFRAGKIHLPRD
jgi:hypothetical protein